MNFRFVLIKKQYFSLHEYPDVMLSYIVNSAGEIAVTHPELALISYGIIFMLWRASAVIRQYLNRPVRYTVHQRPPC